MNSREIEENKENLPKNPLNPERIDRPIYETDNFIVYACGQPHVSREEGGHIMIYAKVDIFDRTKLTPKQAIEYMRLSILTGEALETAMKNRGVPVVKINYLDNGNWAFKYNRKPHLHMHILGRAADAVIQKFPEAVMLPAMESGFYDAFQPLNSDDIEEIKRQIEILLHDERFSSANW